jgi:hypothetical protein
LLSGETESKVEAAAKEKLAGATIVRTETDADGHAAYEVHMVQVDGTPATVYVDKQFNVVSVETGCPGGTRSSRSPGRRHTAAGTGLRACPCSTSRGGRPARRRA